VPKAGLPAVFSAINQSRHWNRIAYRKEWEQARSRAGRGGAGREDVSELSCLFTGKTYCVG
jgi:hypothetical protein